MKSLKQAVFFLTLFSVTLFLPQSIFADGAYGTGCTPVYGGGVQCPRVGQVLVNKTVQNPATGVFVDNLGPADPKYRPEQVVTFHIDVQNSGDQTLDTVTVKDALPSYVDFMSGPGSYDSNSRVLTFTVNNLAGGTDQQYEVKVRTVHPAVLPSDKNVVCLVNTVDAASGGESDHDESQFCIEKQITVTSAPKAGPEHWLLSLAGLGSALVSGLYLRKKAVTS